MPPDPERMFDPRPNRPKVIQSADCFVDAQGVMYLTDNNAGLLRVCGRVVIPDEIGAFPLELG